MQARVVEEHVLGARVARVDPIRGRGRVPVVDRRVVLDARVAADPRGLGHLAEELARLVRGRGLAVGDVVRGPVAVLLDGVHEVVRHADRVVGVLEEDASRRPRR